MNTGLIGLLLNASSALLLVFFPPSTRRYDKEGAPEASWVGNPTPRACRIAALQRVLSRTGRVLLALGFVVQLFGEIRLPSRRSALHPNRTAAYQVRGSDRPCGCSHRACARSMSRC